ncbi:MAG TPA: hypothetical protein VGR97_05190 [Candidatus Acidoferrales bacterium]|nr:hypothetical protein [Candidatus Acidoferrales bacterium]
MSTRTEAAPHVGQEASEHTAPPGAPAYRTKIADGEYGFIEQSNFGAIGPFGEEVYDFHETWTIWRTTTGAYEVEGRRKFESPKNTPHDNRFLVHLTRDLAVVDLTEFSKLRWKPESGPLSCDFLPAELHCFAGAPSHPDVETHAPVQRPFGLIWPVSAFSLSGIARGAERDPNRATEVELARIEQPDKENPVEVTILKGRLRYLGQVRLNLAGQTWRAYEYSLKATLRPDSLIWVSEKGLLLAVAVEHGHANWREEGLRLVRFHQWAAF